MRSDQRVSAAHGCACKSLSAVRNSRLFHASVRVLTALLGRGKSGALQQQCSWLQREVVLELGTFPAFHFSVVKYEFF